MSCDYYFTTCNNKETSYCGLIFSAFPHTLMITVAVILSSIFTLTGYYCTALTAYLGRRIVLRACFNIVLTTQRMDTGRKHQVCTNSKLKKVSTFSFWKTKMQIPSGLKGRKVYIS